MCVSVWLLEVDRQLVIFAQIEIVIANWVTNLLLPDLACIVNIPNYIATSVVPAICAQETIEFQCQQSRCFMFGLGVHHHRKGKSRKFYYVCVRDIWANNYACANGWRQGKCKLLVGLWQSNFSMLSADISVDTNIE